MKCNTVASVAVGRALAETVKASKGSPSPSALAPPHLTFAKNTFNRKKDIELFLIFKKYIHLDVFSSVLEKTIEKR